MSNIQRLHRARLFASHGVAHSNDSTYIAHCDCKGVYDPNYIDVIYPVDPRTGLPMSDLARLANPHLSDAEKESVMSRLQTDKGSYMPSELSDAEILSLVPPRFFSYDQVDIQKWRNYLASEVLPYMDHEIKEELNKSEEVEQPKQETNEDSN